MVAIFPISMFSPSFGFFVSRVSITYIANSDEEIEAVLIYFFSRLVYSWLKILKWKFERLWPAKEYKMEWKVAGNGNILLGRIASSSFYLNLI